MINALGREAIPTCEADFDLSRKAQDNAHRLICLAISWLLVGAVAFPNWIALPQWATASWAGCTLGALVAAGSSAAWTQRRLLTSGWLLLLAFAAHRSMGEALGLEYYARW